VNENLVLPKTRENTFCIENKPDMKS